ncbi:MAG: hypothetical protein IPO63_12025 [Bacteroidetes bacterium]|nr:hypothetical protein [Bacteroidota bacterium]
MKVNQISEQKYNEVRSTELLIAQTLLQQLKSDFDEDPDFEEIRERIGLMDT